MGTFTCTRRAALVRAAAGALAGVLALGIAVPAALATTATSNHHGSGGSGSGHSGSVGPGDSGGVQISGTVESVGATSLVVTDGDGFWRTIVLSTSTTYSETPMRIASPITAANLAIGEKVTAKGTVDPDHTSLDATSVEIDLDHVAGVVTSITSTTILISGWGSSPTTVDLSSATIAFSSSGVVPISTVVVGSKIEAFGAFQSDGSLAALYVGVAPSNGDHEMAFFSHVSVPNCHFPNHQFGHRHHH